MVIRVVYFVRRAVYNMRDNPGLVTMTVVLAFAYLFMIALIFQGIQKLLENLFDFVYGIIKGYFSEKREHIALDDLISIEAKDFSKFKYKRRLMECSRFTFRLAKDIAINNKEKTAFLRIGVDTKRTYVLGESEKYIDLFIAYNVEMGTLHLVGGVNGELVATNYVKPSLKQWCDMLNCDFSVLGEDYERWFYRV